MLCPALFVLPGGSFNLLNSKDAVPRVVCMPLLARGSLKPSIIGAHLAKTRFETPSAHGRGGAPILPFVDIKSAFFYTFLALAAIHHVLCQSAQSIRPGMPGME